MAKGRPKGSKNKVKTTNEAKASAKTGNINIHIETDKVRKRKYTKRNTKKEVVPMPIPINYGAIQTYQNHDYNKVTPSFGMPFQMPGTINGNDGEFVKNVINQIEGPTYNGPTYNNQPQTNKEEQKQIENQIIPTEDTTQTIGDVGNFLTGAGTALGAGIYLAETVNPGVTQRTIESTGSKIKRGASKIKAGGYKLGGKMTGKSNLLNSGVQAIGNLFKGKKKGDYSRLDDSSHGFTSNSLSTSFSPFKREQNARIENAMTPDNYATAATPSQSRILDTFSNTSKKKKPQFTPDARVDNKVEQAKLMKEMQGRYSAKLESASKINPRDPSPFKKNNPKTLIKGLIRPQDPSPLVKFTPIPQSSPSPASLLGDNRVVSRASSRASSRGGNSPVGQNIINQFTPGPEIMQHVNSPASRVSSRASSRASSRGGNTMISEATTLQPMQNSHHPRYKKGYETRKKHGKGEPFTKDTDFNDPYNQGYFGKITPNTFERHVNRTPPNRNERHGGKGNTHAKKKDKDKK